MMTFSENNGRIHRNMQLENGLTKFKKTRYDELYTAEAFFPPAASMLHVAI